MTDPLRITFRHDAEALHEAMLMAGRSLLGRDLPVMALQLLRVLLICFGGAAMVALIAVFAGRIDSIGLVSFLIGAGLAAVIGWTSDTLPYRRMARRILTLPMETGEQQMIATEDSLTFLSKLSAWRTDWQAVTFLKIGKKGLVVGVSGVAFSIPRATFDSKDELVALLTRLQALKDAAT